MKIRISICIALILALMPLRLPVIAEQGDPGPEVHPEYIYMTSIIADLSISSGTASCYGSCYGNSGSTTISVTVKLQRSSDGNTWTTKKTWTASGQGSSIVHTGGTYSVPSGYKYRAYVKATVKDANGHVLESGIRTYETDYY